MRIKNSTVQAIPITTIAAAATTEKKTLLLYTVCLNLLIALKRLYAYTTSIVARVSIANALYFDTHIASYTYLAAR